MTTLVPMTRAEYAAWREASIPLYARDRVEAGEWRESEALANSRAEVDGLLPLGLATPGQHLWAIRDAAHADSIGWLWMGDSGSGRAPSPTSSTWA